MACKAGSVLIYCTLSGDPLKYTTILLLNIRLGWKILVRDERSCLFCFGASKEKKVYNFDVWLSFSHGSFWLSYICNKSFGGMECSKTDFFYLIAFPSTKSEAEIRKVFLSSINWIVYWRLFCTTHKHLQFITLIKWKLYTKYN